MQASPWSSTVDWICIGSGAGGCAAAIAGQAQGFTVMLVESSPLIGGTTSQSAGILWVPMHYLLQEAGIEDSRQAALEYLRYTGAGENRPAYMETLVDHAARVLASLHTQADIDFRLLELAEFYYGHDRSGDHAPGRGPAPCDPPTHQGVVCLWADRGRQLGPRRGVSGWLPADACARARVSSCRTRCRQPRMSSREERDADAARAKNGRCPPGAPGAGHAPAGSRCVAATATNLRRAVCAGDGGGRW